MLIWQLNSHLSKKGHHALRGSGIDKTTFCHQHDRIKKRKQHRIRLMNRHDYRFVFVSCQMMQGTNHTQRICAIQTLKQKTFDKAKKPKTMNKHKPMKVRQETTETDSEPALRRLPISSSHHQRYPFRAKIQLENNCQIKFAHFFYQTFRVCNMR